MIQAIRDFLYDRATFTKVMYVLCFLFGTALLAEATPFVDPLWKWVGGILNGLAIWLAQQAPPKDLPPRTFGLIPWLLLIGMSGPVMVACTTTSPVDAFYRSVEVYNVPLAGAVGWLESPASKLHPKEADQVRAAIAEGDALITKAHRGIQICQERALLEVQEGAEERCVAQLALGAVSTKLDELAAELAAERAAEGGR